MAQLEASMSGVVLGGVVMSMSGVVLGGVVTSWVRVSLEAQYLHYVSAQLLHYITLYKYIVTCKILLL